MAFRTGRFRRADRILCSRDFGRAMKCGKRRSSRRFVVVASRTGRTDGEFAQKRRRLGVTVSARVGSSVIRNRVKRRVREWFRHARGHLRDGSDIVVIARRGAGDLSSREVASTLDALLPGARSRQGDRTTAEHR